MMPHDDIKEYDAVEYTAGFNDELNLATGEVGCVLEDYGDGNYEVEFSFPDGTTWLQCALPGRDLKVIDQSSLQSLRTVARSFVFPAIIGYENGEGKTFIYPPTGENLQVDRENSTGSIVVSTKSRGVVAKIVRPRNAAV